MGCKPYRLSAKDAEKVTTQYSLPDFGDICGNCPIASSWVTVSDSASSVGSRYAVHEPASTLDSALTGA